MNYVSFYGGETSGSIGKQNLNPTRKALKAYGEPQCDTVNFKSHNNNYYYEQEKPSVFSKLAKVVVASAVVIGGLGYAHKAGWVNKISNDKVKNFANKITEPCHNLCSKTKETATTWYNKIADHFKK